MRLSFSKPTLLLLGAFALFGGCAHQTGTVTKSAASFLVFLGDTTEAKVTIDSNSFSLTQANANDHFEVAPGIHRVKIEKQGTVVVDRELLLSDRQTIEVTIP